LSEEWTGAGLGLKALRGGRSPEEVDRAFAEMTPFERHCALTGSDDPYVILSPATGIARVLALREARDVRRDLSEAEWQQSVLLVYNGLSQRQQQSASELLSAIAAVRPPTGGSLFGGLTIDRIVEALTSWSGDWPPSQDDFAATALRLSDRRMRQVLRGAGTTWRAVIEEARVRR